MIPDHLDLHRLCSVSADADGSTSPFVGQPTIPNLDYLVQASTPVLGASIERQTYYILWGHDENFSEWSSGRVITATAAVNVRPTDHLRLNLSYTHQQVNRRADGLRRCRRFSSSSRALADWSNASWLRAFPGAHRLRNTR